MARHLSLAIVLCTALSACAAASAGQWAGHSPSEWKSRTIYQVLTDRFNNPSGNGCSNLNLYCGGTFNGLVDQLDYITSMGFDAIWISPIIENIANGYHGYWAKDLYAVNSNFGTAEDLTNFVNAAHAKDVWVMLDVVANHMGYDPNGPGSFNPFNSQSDYHDCNGCPSNCQIQNFQDQPQVQHCRLAGLPDLNQTDPWVAQQLTSWVNDMVQTYKFDGLRVDTVPEVNMPFWRSFQAAAGVYAVGEVFNGNVAYVAPYQGGALDAVLSYPMYFTMRNVYQSGQSMYQLQSMNNAYKVFKDVDILGTFIDNQDNDRFLTGNSDYKKYENAIAYTLMSTGIPIIYYGTEQGFAGTNNNAQNRAPLWPTKFATTNSLYTFIKTVVAYRKSAQVWNYPQVQRYADDTFYAFTRGNSFVATTNVGSSGSPQQRTITYQPYADGTKLCNLFYPTTDCLVVNNGQFNVYLESGQCKIYYPVTP